MLAAFFAQLPASNMPTVVNFEVRRRLGFCDRSLRRDQSTQCFILTENQRNTPQKKRFIRHTTSQRTKRYLSEGSLYKLDAATKWNKAKFIIPRKKSTKKGCSTRKVGYVCIAKQIAIANASMTCKPAHKSLRVEICAGKNPFVTHHICSN